MRSMNVNEILQTLPESVRALSGVRALCLAVHTLTASVQSVSEHLKKAQEKIISLKEELSKLRKVPKKPKFRPGGMASRGQKPSKKSQKDEKVTPLPVSNTLKRAKEVVVLLTEKPVGAKFKGHATWSVQDIEVAATETVYTHSS